MIALLQRVARAHVEVDGRVVGRIGPGLMVLLCAERGDAEAQGDALLARLLAYRVFADDAGRMNRSLRDVGGGLLLVPQFTLAADTRSGAAPELRSGRAAAGGTPAVGRVRVTGANRPSVVETGIFGADMQVHLVNDGPVTFRLDVAPRTGTDGTPT